MPVGAVQVTTVRVRMLVSSTAAVPLVTLRPVSCSTSHGWRMSLSGAGSRPVSSASTVKSAALISSPTSVMPSLGLNFQPTTS